MRTKIVEISMTVEIQVNDEFSSDDNDAIAIGSAMERWASNQPTVNPDREDIGVTRFWYSVGPETY